MPPRKKVAAATTNKVPTARPQPSVAATQQEDEQVDEPSSVAGPSSGGPQEGEGGVEGGVEGDDPVDAMAARQSKMAALRKRMAESATSNRKDLIAETTAARSSAKTVAKLERKRKQLESMGEKAEAAETGEDLERKKNWEYSIEDNEKWDKKKARKTSRADFSYTDLDDLARRKYKKNMDDFKPDHKLYNAQRAAASAVNPSMALLASTSYAQQAAHDDLYRDANSFVYGDHKPSEDAIDKVIGKINVDIAIRNNKSRARKNEDDGDVTYINDKNKIFNKKLDRFYNSHTQEVRDNFERGTAL